MPTVTQYENGLHEIPLGALKPNPANPRKTFPEAELRELADSIKTHGVIQPIRARTVDGKMQIITGERRWRASKLAGKETIPTVVDNAITDEQSAEIAIIENVQRSDVHPLDEAMGYLELKNLLKIEVEGIAKKVGKSASYVYQRLKLSSLVDKGQELFRSGFLTAAHAVDIARLEIPDQHRAINYCQKGPYGDDKRESAPAFLDLRNWIRDNIHLDLSKVAWDLADKELLPAAGACVDCPKRAGNSPALFPDVGKDTCLDSACFNQKRIAFVKLQASKVEDKTGAKPILVSHEMEGPRGKRGKDAIKDPIVYAADFRERYFKGGEEHKIELDSCKSTAIAVYVDDGRHDRAKIGKQVVVCTDRNCKIHKDTYSVNSDIQSAQRSDAAARKRAKLEKTSRILIFRELAKRVKALSRIELQAIALNLFDKIGHFEKLPLLEALEWGTEFADYRQKNKLSKKIGSMPSAELEKHILLFSLASDLNVAMRIKTEHLDGLAIARGVKVGEILRSVKEQAKTKPAKAAKKSAAKKAAPQKPAAAKGKRKAKR